MRYKSEDIKRIREEKNYNQTEFAEQLGITRELLNKIENGKRPISKATEILLDKLCEKNSEISHTTNHSNMQPDFTQELINSLKKNIEILEKNVGEKEDLVQKLIKVNTDLKEVVHANLQTSLDNQLALTALVESTIHSLSQVLVTGGEQQQQKFRLDLHKDAFQRLKVYKRTGNHIEIDSESMISDNS